MSVYPPQHMSCHDVYTDHMEERTKVQNDKEASPVPQNPNIWVLLFTVLITKVLTGHALP